MFNCSMYRFLLDNQADPKKKKMVYFNRTFRSEELLSEVEKYAVMLSDLGIKDGDVVTLLLPNIPEAVFLVYAINKLGAIASLVHPFVGGKIFQEIMEKTKSRLVFVLDFAASKLQKELQTSGAKIFYCCASNYAKGIIRRFIRYKEPKDIIFEPMTLPNKSIKLTKEVINNGDVPSVYLHSGGTTGDPKTAIISSYSFNKLTEMLEDTIINTVDVDDKDCMLAMLPIFHGFGLGVSIHGILPKYKIVLVPKFNGTLVNLTVRFNKATFLAGVPTMFEKMQRSKFFGGKYLANIKQIYVGGERLNSHLKKVYDARIKSYGGKAELLEGYGLSEASSVITVNKNGKTKANSQGQALCGGEIKILKENLEVAKPYEVGEILINSPTIMLGYLDDEVATTEVFVSINGVKHLKTGDIGYLDEEGFLFFESRKSRAIKISGENVFPSKIEESVNQIPVIKDSCAIRTEENGKASLTLLVIVKDNLELTNSELLEIKSKIASDIGKYAVPKTIIRLDNIVKTPFGKNNYRFYEDNMDKLFDN